jgi:hypothetical protein
MFRRAEGSLIFQQVAKVVFVVDFTVIVGVCHAKHIANGLVVDLTVSNGLKSDRADHPKRFLIEYSENID